MKDLWRLYGVPSCDCCTALERDLNASFDEEWNGILRKLKQSCKESEETHAQMIEAQKEVHDLLKARGRDEGEVEASKEWKEAHAELVEGCRGMRDLVEAHRDMREDFGEELWSTFERILAQQKAACRKR